MKKIGIVTDSHSSISQKEAEKMGIMVLPMPFYIDDVCYYEDVTLSRSDFFERMAQGAAVRTSQPSPAEVMELWDRALQEYEQILYLPISSGLSGSCETAMMLAREEAYEGRVYVVDNGRVSTPLHRSILDALALVEAGYDAAGIREKLEAGKQNMVIYIGVQTLEYLKRGGRITGAAAAVGTVLNIKPVLKLDIETLDSFKKCHGTVKMKKTMLEAVQQDLETRFQDAYAAGKVHLLAASSASPEETQAWIEEIQTAFPDMPVLCDDLSLGVSCHTGPGALGIGLSVAVE